MFIKRGVILFFFFFSLIVTESRGTHIVGGELNYTYLGGNDYQIRLIVYRDCYNGLAPFDHPASIGIFDSNNILVYNLLMDTVGGGPIPNVINSPCVQAPTNICYEYAIYEAVVNLPPIPGGYQLAYQRCCRNGTITNVTNPGNVGATYYATIPDTSVVAVNSNPRYTNLPMTFICADVPFQFDHSATDSDGDSLVYELCTPIDGASAAFPMPQPPNSPPYIPIVFQAPYNLGNVMGGVPMTIDPVTGLLTATPNMQGQFVYGVCVNEYRNGVLIGRTSRDYQINVVACQNLTVASLFSPAFLCGTNQATFLNNSAGASTYDWDFGDPTTLGDTSDLVSPSYIYPDSGTYQITLIAHSSIDPICTDTTYGTIHVFPSFFSGLDVINQHCSNVFNFSDASYGVSAPADFWSWSFGDGTFSSNQNEVHAYSSTGTYTVTFISSADSGCTDTTSIVIHVLDVPVISFTSVIDTCQLQITLSDSSTFATHYAWSFGDGYYSDSANVSHAYTAGGSYNINLVATTDSGCADTSNFTILLPPLTAAAFYYQHNFCDSIVSYFNNSQNAIQYNWDFGDGSVSTNLNEVHTYSNPGTYVSTLIVSSAHCSDTVSQAVTIDTIPIAAFTHPFVCDLTNEFLDGSINANYYNWSFGDSYNSPDQNPIHHYVNPGLYDVTLVVSTEAGCSDTITQAVMIYASTVADFTPQVVPCNSRVSFNNNTVNGYMYNWDFGDGANTTTAIANPIHIYPDSGSYTVTLISNPGVCADTASENFRVTIPPVASFHHPDECGLTAHFVNQSTGNIFSHWNFGDGITSNDLNPEHTFDNENTYSVILVAVNSDLCTDTSSLSLRVKLPSIAAFNNYIDTCEQNVKLLNQSKRADSYWWDFGDGTSSTNLNAVHQYPNSGNYDVMLVTDPNSACADTMLKVVSAVGPEESRIYIPNAFTPNGDGKNDGFVISGYNKCLSYRLTIFNRWGEKLYETSDITRSWDGYFNGGPIEEGVYVYLLTAGDNEILGHVTVLK